MKLVILDRDGVINQDSDAFIKNSEEWKPLPGSLEAIAALNHAGYHVVVASNQSGIARGLLDIDALNGIHRKFHHLLGQVGGHVDAIFFCPHGPSNSCDCRKPKPGMYHEIALRFHCTLSEVYAIGDSPRDLQAASQAAAIPLLVRTGNGRATELHPEFDPNTAVFDDLAAAVTALLRSEHDTAAMGR